MNPKIYKYSAYGMQDDPYAERDDVYGYVKLADFEKLRLQLRTAMRVIALAPTRLEEFQQEMSPKNYAKGTK